MRGHLSFTKALHAKFESRGTETILCAEHVVDELQELMRRLSISDGAI
jgi:hypothetical protein